MPRKPIVSRVLKTTSCRCLCLNLETEQTFKEDFNVSGHYKDDVALLRHVSKKCGSDTVKILAVLSSSKNQALYGVYEDDFYRIAKQLDPATRKPITE